MYLHETCECLLKICKNNQLTEQLSLDTGPHI